MARKLDQAKRTKRMNRYRYGGKYGKTKTVSTGFGKYQKRQKEYRISDKHMPEYQMISTEIWEKA
jgi:hypothetical protein